MDSHEPRSFSGLAFVLIAISSGALTWLCVRWFGAQDPLTAAIAVILVELFLACFAMIAALIVERVSATYLGYEKTFLTNPVEPRRLWLWRPLWEPRVRRASSHLGFTDGTEDWRPDLREDQSTSETVAFPKRSTSRRPSVLPRRRAA